MKTIICSKCGKEEQVHDSRECDYCYECYSFDAKSKLIEKARKKKLRTLPWWAYEKGLV